MKKIITAIILFSISQIYINGCKGCKSEPKARFDAKYFIVAVPINKAMAHCSEFYRNEFTTDDAVKKIHDLAEAVHKNATMDDCPKDNILLIVKAWHDGKERKYPIGISLAIGSFDAIYYYYKGGLYKTADEAKKHAETAFPQAYGYSIQYSK